VKVRLRLETIIWTSSICLLIGAWASHMSATNFSSRLAQERKAVKSQYPLVGSRLDLRAAVVPTNGSDFPGEFSQALVFVYSDRCGICKGNRPNWDRLISEISLNVGQELWIITLNTTRGLEPTLQKAREIGLRTRGFRTRDPDLFGYATGVRGTPSTLVVDGKGVARAVMLGDVRVAMEAITSTWAESSGN
jgi:hypothetical protein